ncbi:MAG: hypothetical protein SH848_04875 [Saprospiraceae bacterium]|nr:hypothetical protein [Saprospiraceae bacterium]MDZ4703238.1 hypothetical protein [Saprospiraceae bacterium]
MAFKTRQQLADEFGINVRTLYRWLTKWNVNLPGGLIRPSDQDAIYRIVGKPERDSPKSEERKPDRSERKRNRNKRNSDRSYS